MDVTERELLEVNKRRSLDCYAQAYKRIVDAIPPVPHGGVLARAGYGEMPDIRHT